MRDLGMAQSVPDPSGERPPKDLAHHNPYPFFTFIHNWVQI